MSRNSSVTITGVILAGGRATRMGGHDKGLLHLNGRPMIQYVLESLTPQVDEVLINANRHLEEYGQFGPRVVTDEPKEFSGPLAGMAAALYNSQSEYILSVPCDGPWVPKDLAQRLLQAAQQQGTKAAAAHDGERLQPVFALIHRDLLPTLEAYLAAGDRKLGMWVRQQEAALVDFSDQVEAFFNVNSPAELQEAEKRLAGER